jgi:hypothetical protein
MGHPSEQEKIHASSTYTWPLLFIVAWHGQFTVVQNVLPMLNQFMVFAKSCQCTMWIQNSSWILAHQPTVMHPTPSKINEKKTTIEHKWHIFQ